MAGVVNDRPCITVRTLLKSVEQEPNLSLDLTVPG